MRRFASRDDNFKDYGKELAEVIVNITGNLISGQVPGDTAKHLSERFGKIQQDRTAISLTDRTPL